MRAGRLPLILAVCSFWGALPRTTWGASVGTALTYQGKLSKNGAPVTDSCNFEFRLYDDPIGVTQIGVTQTIAGVAVVNGLFTVEVNSGGEFGANAFDGDERWLEIAVQGTGDMGFSTLNPRQRLTPSPYALALPGLWTQQNPTSPNVIGGSKGNSVTAGVHGATIGGGGQGNAVTDEWGTVGGGANNRAGNGAGTTSDATYATVGGGTGNTASGLRSTIAGGRNNIASGINSAVGGGGNNTASDSNTVVAGGANNNASGFQSAIAGGSTNSAAGDLSTVGGGDHNVAGGYLATVPGGSYNQAVGTYSLAVGRRALAGHTGSFVWSDSTTADSDFFASTGANQFLINATGGVGINTNAPNAALHIGGIAGVDGLMFPDGSLQTTAAIGGGDGHSLDAADGVPVDAVFVDNNGNVDAIGDVTAVGKLVSEDELRLEDPSSGTDLCALTRNVDGHGQLVTYADGVSVASAVVGTDTDANGAGGIVLLSFDNALGPAVKLDSVSNSGRATLARSTGVLQISESLVMYADAPKVSNPAITTNGGGLDLLQDDGTRTFLFRGSNDLDAGGCMRAFNGSGDLVFNLDTGATYPVLRMHDGSGTSQNQLEVAATTTGSVLALYDSAGLPTIRIDGEESDGAGRVTTQKIVVTGDSSSAGACVQAFNGNGGLVFDVNTGATDPVLRMRDGSGTSHNQVEVAASTTGGVLTLYDSAGLPTVRIDGEESDGAGRVTTQKLAITGGADLSEQFDVRSPTGEVKPGMVVCIDPKRPGNLIVSDRAYDRSVAGVVSGAGGVAPGMLMGQQGSVADGKHPVALTGRVYVLADASHGAIHAGDLLTTSETPGHAMKAVDYDRARGAAIGKAMTALKTGTGLVLVLVQPQ